MVKIPSALLRDRLTIAPYKGAGAYGPMYDAPITVKARVEGRRRTVNRGDGSTVISSATAFVRPDVSVLPESKATWDGRDFEVLDVLPAKDLTGTTHVELLLGAR